MVDPQQRQVLVLDGAAEVANLMRVVLQEAGYQVSVMTEMPVAMADVSLRDVDLVIVDPVMDGADPHEWLRHGAARRFHEADIPFVVCSGHGRVLHDLADALAARGIDVLPKPFAIEALRQVVAVHPGSSTASGDA